LQIRRIILQFPCTLPSPQVLDQAPQVSDQAHLVNPLTSVINNNRWICLITYLPRCFQMSSPWSVLRLCHIYCHSFPLLSGYTMKL